MIVFGTIGRERGPQRFTLHAWIPGAKRTVCGLVILRRRRAAIGYHICNNCVRWIPPRRSSRIHRRET